jgi:hypothetical protein
MRWRILVFAAVGSVGLVGCASSAPRSAVDRSSTTSRVAPDCRAGTATYTVTNGLSRRVAIYRTGGSSGSTPLFVGYLDAGESLQVDGLPVKVATSRATPRYNFVYFFGSDDLDGGSRPSALRIFDQRRITTKVKCDPTPEATR